MKVRTTQKEIKNAYKNIISVPYCALQNLLNYQNPVAYASRRTAKEEQGEAKNRLARRRNRIALYSWKCCEKRRNGIAQLARIREAVE